MEKLAINGGSPLISEDLEKYRWISETDIQLVSELLASNKLSGFLAQPTDDHLGGNWVRKLENKWSRLLGSDFAVSFNSWTSGLEACMGSIDLEKGSEVVVTPWTMSATVSAIVLNGFIPHFADISNETFNLTCESIKSAVNSRTQAVLVVDIFGLPCEIEEIKEFCFSRNLKLIVDAAQTPLAKTKFGNFTVNIADVGGFSLNRHKHLQVGEGGVALTKNKEIANNLRNLRNHAESTYSFEDNKFNSNIQNGHNWRMGEIEALLAHEQLSRINKQVEDRRNFARILLHELKNIDVLSLPENLGFEYHDYYIIGMKIKDSCKVPRDKLVAALNAEGIPGIVSNYASLHRLNSFSKFPRQRLVNTEVLNDKTVLGFYNCGLSFSEKNIELISGAFKKVFNNINSLG